MFDIDVKIEKIADIKEAVVEIYKNCPHQFNDNDIISEMEKGIDEIKKRIEI